MLAGLLVQYLRCYRERKEIRDGIYGPLERGIRDSSFAIGIYLVMGSRAIAEAKLPWIWARISFESLVGIYFWYARPYKTIGLNIVAGGTQAVLIIHMLIGLTANDPFSFPLVCFFTLLPLSIYQIKSSYSQYYIWYHWTKLGKLPPNKNL